MDPVQRVAELANLNSQEIVFTSTTLHPLINVVEMILNLNHVTLMDAVSIFVLNINFPKQHNTLFTSKPFGIIGQNWDVQRPVALEFLGFREIASTRTLLHRLTFVLEMISNKKESVQPTSAVSLL